MIIPKNNDGKETLFFPQLINNNFLPTKHSAMEHRNKMNLPFGNENFFNSFPLKNAFPADDPRFTQGA
jgi:hypothetical protein